MTSTDVSILGLLLRAHGACAAQEHGEQYIFDNLSASSHFEQAKNSIENAIKSLSFAEQYVVRQTAEGNRHKKEVTA